MSAKIEEPEEFSLKRYEELFRFAKGGFDLEQERFSAAESKVERYVSLLVLVLGAGTVIGVREFSAVLKELEHGTVFHWTFVISYGIFYITSILALFTFLRAVSMREIRMLPVDRSMADHFHKNRYIDVLSSLSHRFLEAAEHNRERVGEKYRAASLGFKLLEVALLMAVVSTASYVFTLIR